MSTTTSTATDLRLTASEWAEVCGLTDTDMLHLLASMPPGIVDQDLDGRWSLTQAFVARYGRALRELVADNDETDNEPDAQGAGSSIVGVNDTLPCPARSRRERNRNSPVRRGVIA